MKNARGTRLISLDVHRRMLADLARSGLEKEWKQLGCTPKERAGFAVTPSYIIPYFDLDGNPTGFYRERYLGDTLPTDARGKKQRYTQPRHTLPAAYFCPLVHNWRRIAADPSLAVYFCEGEKKAARACKVGLTCIGLGGVWNFKSTRAGITFLPELEAFNWKGREVAIVFDSDVVGKPDVRRAELELSAQLTSRGAHVSVVRLPDSNNNAERRI